MFIVMVMSTSASTTPEHGRETVKVCGEFGIEPVFDMFSFGRGNAGGFEVSTFIE